MNELTIKIILICFLLVSTAGISFAISENNNLENRDIYVDSSYRGYSDGTAEHPFQSFQTAIDAAESEDNIYVFGGIYEEIITVDKHLNLWGGIEGSESIITSNDDVRYTMKITADNVEIQDFIFTDQNKVKTSPIGALISVQSENVAITSNQFYETDSYGIHIDETASGTVLNGNTINNTMFGIVVESSDTNDIFNNEIYQCEDSGIRLENTAENRLYDNTIYDCSKAILASYCLGLNITNNEFYNIGYAGMLLQSCQQVIVRENNVYDNPGTGLYLTSDFCTISENNFESNLRGIILGGNNNNIYQNQFTFCEGSGIFAQDNSSQNTFYNNHIENNDYGLYLTQFCNKNTIAHNNFINNDENVFCSYSLFNSWISNYWDDWDGNLWYIINCEPKFLRFFNIDFNPVKTPYNIAFDTV